MSFRPKKSYKKCMLKDLFECMNIYSKKIKIQQQIEEESGRIQIKVEITFVLTRKGPSGPC